MLSRRQFLSLLASGVASDLLLPNSSLALANPDLHAALLQDVGLKKRYLRQTSSYGSGLFGEWVEDANGLPCYHYTCDQNSDAIAATPTEVAWRSSTDQTHQIGNDRITAAVSNYGYVQVRQDEGGPKFLNDYKPDEGLFGAGLGYLTDGEEVLATYFPGSGLGFERFFGMGYVRKHVTGKNFSVEQTIFAPFGDDPVLISEVVISSQSPKPTNLRWVEYWGCQLYEFSYRSFLEGAAAGSAQIGDANAIPAEQIANLRRVFARSFDHHFEKMPGGIGVVESKHYRGRPEVEEQAWIALQEQLTKIPVASLSPPVTLPPIVNAGAASAKVASMDDTTPPATFLASLDEGPVRMLTSATSFFGKDNLLRPHAVLHPVGFGTGAPEVVNPDDLSATGFDSALILEKPFTLEPGQSVTLRFVYGYLPRGFTAEALIAKYRASANGLLAKDSAAWHGEGIQFSVSSDPWVEREVRWHSYYLRSGLTYDDFFEEHILSQGQTYQYIKGLQSAARDPLQHALPLVFGDAKLAKEILRYALKTQAADGSLPIAVAGHGMAIPGSFPPSDLDLWLLWLASEYILGTRDTAFLEEKILTYPLQPESPRLAVRELLARSYRHLVEGIGVGKHGLLRGLSGDWNDQIYRRSAPESQADEVHRESESVMNGAMAAYILEHYASMLRYAGDAKSAADASSRASQQREAVRAQWTGKWFKRLWLGSTSGWVGDTGPNAGAHPDNRLWLDGQPWAILGQCATPEQQKVLVGSMDELLRKPSRIGAKQVSKSIDWPGIMPGEAANGAVWAALDGPLIWALSGIDGAMAWDEWMKNTRGHHAEVFPAIWYAIWSGPDLYCSSDSDHSGQTGYDWGLSDFEAQHRPSNYRGLSDTAWPVMNMHRHAWPLYSAAKLMGIEFTELGLDLAPSIPKAVYSFHSKLVGFDKTERGYQGWYAPMKDGGWTVRLKLATNESGLKHLTVNGTAKKAKIGPDGRVEFTGNSTSTEPLRWSLLKD